MPVTTVINEDDATAIVTQDEPKRFSWSAAFAGAFVAAGVTFFLLTLGSGVGLSLVTVRGATQHGAITFLSLGAIYFLAAQAFGFAAGGHVVGRIIGPAIETTREEEWRAGLHGLVSWALAVVATATVVALAAIAGGSAATNGAVNGAVASTSTTRGADAQPAATAYWTDMLFRPATAPLAALAWKQYAQAETGTMNDGAPATAEPTPLDNSDGQPVTTPETAPAGGQSVLLNNANSGSASAVPVTTQPLTPPTLRSLGADKGEAGRILTAAGANGGTMSAEDHTQLARLVAQDTGLTLGAAQARVTDVLGKMREDATRTAEAARKTAAYASLWTALALLFGAVVAVAAAISARWEDDRAMGLGTRVVDTRF